MKKNISTILVLLSLFLVACSPEAFTFDNLPILRDQDIFFVDEFSDPKSGWLAEKNDNIILEYSPEGFWIISNNQNTIAWSLPGMNFKDVQAEVSVSKVTGSDNNAFGILCRYKNKDNYYRFSISAMDIMELAKSRMVLKTRLAMMLWILVLISYKGLKRIDLLSSAKDQILSFMSMITD